jgi:hypothetical protein
VISESSIEKALPPRWEKGRVGVVSVRVKKRMREAPSSFSVADGGNTPNPALPPIAGEGFKA